MKNIKYIFLFILILCCFYPNVSSAQNQNIEKKYDNDEEVILKFGYSQFLTLNDFSRYLKGGAGIQMKIDVPYKRFVFCASENLGFPKAKSDFILNNNTVNVNDKMQVSVAGFSTSYAILYTENLKISPLAGIGWCALSKNDNSRPKNIFTETVGFQIESRAITLARLPLYLEYNYCFPKKYSNEIHSGMHFISIGVIMVLAWR